MKFKSIILRILKGIGYVLGLILLYILCGYFIPFIEVPAEKTSEPKTVDIYLYTNGVHTDIVVPIKNEQYDWSQTIPFENTRSQKTGYRYLSVGWGDKGFYLDTPTWADLKFSTAFKAAFWLSESAMHCTFYDKMTEGEDCVKISVTKTQYDHLIQYINAKFDRDKNGNIILIKTNAVYGNNDTFYDAHGSYSFLNTCNTWTNNALKAAGQKAALWSPSDFGIFQHYK